MHNKLLATRLPAALLAIALLLAACGGGGDGGNGVLGPPPSARFGASSQFAGICTLEGEKRFVRSYLDEHYLWYSEIPEINAAAYANIRDYFDALTALPKDNFSAAIPSASADNVLAQSFAPADALSNHTNTVPIARVTTDAAGRRVAYIQFNDHEVGAQDDLITAFRQVRDAGAQHLVLDLRFNTGGFLYIARTAASMIAGPAAQGRVFESLRYNDKRQAESNANTFFFSTRVETPEGQYGSGTELPQLNLPRVYVLTSGQTCSSSESIVNGLRGIELDVVLVGSTTCGKPYGFHRKDNCGTAYFPIEFQASNAKGFGDYTAGFRPTCNVADNRNPGLTAAGPSDPLLNAALFHIDTGSCPPGTATALAQSSATPQVGPARPGRPAWAGRLLAPPR